MDGLVRLRRRLWFALRRGRLAGDAEVTDATLVHHVGRDAEVILEVGAHDGTTTERLLRLFPRARIFAFEPDTRAREKHKVRVADARVEVFPYALAAFDGRSTFYVSGGRHPDAGDAADEWDYSGSIRRPTGHLVVHPWVTFDETTQVDVRRLDTWATEKGVDRVDLIWADVQGAEVDLIAGGTDTLASTRYLYTEYSDVELYEGAIDLRGIVSMLPSFRVRHRYPNDALLENTRP